MFDQLFAGIATGFAAQFGGPYLDASARWPGTPTMDPGGSITAPGAAVSLSCKVQFDSVTEAMRSAPDFLETDVRILVLSATLDARLDTKALIVLASGDRAGTYTLLSCDIDPAGIGYSCRARKAP